MMRKNCYHSDRLIWQFVFLSLPLGQCSLPWQELINSWSRGPWCSKQSSMLWSSFCWISRFLFALNLTPGTTLKGNWEDRKIVVGWIISTGTFSSSWKNVKMERLVKTKALRTGLGSHSKIFFLLTFLLPGVGQQFIWFIWPSKGYGEAALEQRMNQSRNFFIFSSRFSGWKTRERFLKY